MSEEMTKVTEITEEELDDIAGGKSKKSKAEKTKNKCLECMKGTHLGSADNSSYIYKAKGDSTTCCKNGHIWEGGIYTHYSPAEATEWFKKHS